MDAGIKTVQDLLSGSSVFLIPHFQRSYSWGEKQWRKLWDDVVALSDEGGSKKHFIGWRPSPDSGRWRRAGLRRRSRASAAIPFERQSWRR